MLNKQKIIFLGGGNMARAIFTKLINAPHFALEVIQRNPAKRIALAQEFPTLEIKEKLDYSPPEGTIVIIAIKPQQAAEGLSAVGMLLDKCIIISVMAGLNSQAIQKWINTSQIIRIMPNTPASVQQGISAIYYPLAIRDATKNLVNQIFNSMGMIYLAKQEEEIDKILPITSSAVAFVYYFMEGMINSAIKQFNFNEKDAKELVIQTLKGSIALAENSPQVNISDLRAQVTSKKGTTEQGIITFEQHHFHSIINDAMLNSYKRGLEMAKEFS